MTDQSPPTSGERIPPDAPKVVYLNLCDERDCTEPFTGHDEVTWTADHAALDHAIRYVREDAVAPSAEPSEAAESYEAMACRLFVKPLLDDEYGKPEVLDFWRVEYQHAYDRLASVAEVDEENMRLRAQVAALSARPAAGSETRVDPKGLHAASLEHAKQIDDYNCPVRSLRPSVIAAYLAAVPPSPDSTPGGTEP